jgi:hypothetical protein
MQHYAVACVLRKVAVAVTMHPPLAIVKFNKSSRCNPLKINQGSFMAGHAMRTEAANIVVIVVLEDCEKFDFVMSRFASLNV